MLPESILVFFFTCLVIELTPGPNMGYLTVLSLNAGRRVGFVTVAGIALGLLTIGMASALGMAEIIASSPTLLSGIHSCGVAYLFWLAWRSWRDKSELAPDTAQLDKSRARYFRRGFITNILNAKALVFYVVALPSFVSSAEHALFQAILMTVISVAVATVVHGTIVVLAARFHRRMQSAKQRDRGRKLSALSLALVAVWLAFAGK